MRLASEGFTLVKPVPGEYRTDGKHLYYVLHVGTEMSRVEDCGAQHCDVIEIETPKLSKLEVVKDG